MKIAMLSPYSLSRLGGVQGQVLGLARALRTLGHEVTVIGPEDPEERKLTDDDDGPGERFIMGRPTGLRSNGSVAPVTISPVAAMRA
jgi:phosphatidylinositol alpha-mannosyltransferase